jgi:hypothetical protein
MTTGALYGADKKKLYILTFNTVRIIKSRRMRWERLSRCFEGMRSAYKIQLADLE